jgi:hypothetical protein
MNRIRQLVGFLGLSPGVRFFDFIRYSLSYRFLTGLKN